MDWFVNYPFKETAYSNTLISEVFLIPGKAVDLSPSDSFTHCQIFSSLSRSDFYTKSRGASLRLFFSLQGYLSYLHL